MKIRLKNSIEGLPVGTEVEVVECLTSLVAPEAQWVGGKYRLILPPSPKGYGVTVVLVSPWEVEVLE